MERQDLGNKEHFRLERYLYFHKELMEEQAWLALVFVPGDVSRDRTLAQSAPGLKCVYFS